VTKRLRWVPDSLTAAQKAENVTMSNQLLRQLRSIEHHGWQLIITLDQSWFYFSTDHEHTRLCPEEQPPEMPKQAIQGRKMMPTITWNPLRFQLLEAPSKGRTFNAEHNRDNILMALLPPGRRSMGENLLFIQIMPDPTQLESVQLLHRKQTAAYRTRLILHHLTSFSSDMSNTA
jgi:hypothetical protein